MDACDTWQRRWAGPLRGVAAGLACVVVGHPFDTLKARLQTTGVVHVRHLLHGISAPLAVTSLSNAIFFGTHDGVVAAGSSSFVGGFLGGCFAAPIVAVGDAFKIQRQVRGSDIRTTLRVVRQRCSEPVFLGRSLLITAARDSVAMGTYFGVFHACLPPLRARLDSGDILPAMLAGSTAGCCSWLVCFCLDTIKTRVQLCDGSIREAARRGGLWRGIRLALVRAVFVNAAALTVADVVARRLRE